MERALQSAPQGLGAPVGTGGETGRHSGAVFGKMGGERGVSSEGRRCHCGSFVGPRHGSFISEKAQVASPSAKGPEAATKWHSCPYLCHVPS